FTSTPATPRTLPCVVLYIFSPHQSTLSAGRVQLHSFAEPSPSVHSLPCRNPPPTTVNPPGAKDCAIVWSNRCPDLQIECILDPFWTHTPLVCQRTNIWSL